MPTQILANHEQVTVNDLVFLITDNEYSQAHGTSVIRLGGCYPSKITLIIYMFIHMDPRINIHQTRNDTTLFTRHDNSLESVNPSASPDFIFADKAKIFYLPIITTEGVLTFGELKFEMHLDSVTISWNF